MNCLHCGADTTNGLALCARCLNTLSIACTNVAAYFTDVEKIQPGERIPTRGVPKSTPPPGADGERIDRISEALDHVTAIVAGWGRNLVDDRPGSGSMPTTVVRVLGWLESHRTTIATLEWGGECLRELRQCERMLQRLLDRSDTGRFIGICSSEIGADTETDEMLLCDRALYAPESVSWVTCPQCGVSWPVAERRRLLADATRDELAPVRVIARVIVGLLPGQLSEERVTRRIEQWVRRGQLQDYGVRVIDGKPRRVYRVGDVLEIVLGERKPGDRVA